MKVSGDRNQCPTCGELFNSTRAFDKHRTGSYGYFGKHRRCLSDDEMKARGMTKNAKGFWITVKNPRFQKVTT